MGGIIFFIFMVMITLNIIKSTKKVNTSDSTFNKGTTVNPPIQNRQIPNQQITGQQISNQQMSSRTVPNDLYRGSSTSTMTTNYSTAHTKPVHTMNSSNSAKTTTVSARTKNSVTTKGGTEKKKSTTQILNEKAMEDNVQHQREKSRQEQENRQVYGKIQYAGRFILGDSIPKGKKLVSCQYCAAENIIPEFEAKKNYNCYFCREKL